jgi:hypothetical protein
MQIRVKVDTRQLTRRLGDLARKAPQAIANGINRTAEELQRVQRADQRRSFTVRRPAFVDKAVKIKPFARRGSLFAIVLIDPPGGQARASILTQHEQGGPKRAKGGGRVAVPIDARRNKSDIVQKGQRIRALNLHPDGRGRIIGARRVFIAGRRGEANQVVLQRVGKGKRSKVRVLYSLERSVPLTPRLHFKQNAERVVRQSFARNLEAGIKEAIERARKA